MSTTYYVMTAFGQDRPGIVAEVTRTVFKAGGNIEDASMTRLGGEFTMMLVVALNKAGAGPRLQESLPAFQKKTGLVINVKPIAPSQAFSKKPAQPTHLISVYGTDRPGIVYRAAQALSDRGINITDLNTKTLQRSGRPLYVMLLEVQMRSRTQAQAVQKSLKRLAQSLRLDVTVQDIDAISL